MRLPLGSSISLDATSSGNFDIPTDVWASTNTMTSLVAVDDLDIGSPYSASSSEVIDLFFMNLGGLTGATHSFTVTTVIPSAGSSSTSESSLAWYYSVPGGIALAFVTQFLVAGSHNLAYILFG